MLNPSFLQKKGEKMLLDAHASICIMEHAATACRVGRHPYHWKILLCLHCFKNIAPSLLRSAF